MTYSLTFTKFQPNGDQLCFVGNQFESYTSKVVAIKEAIECLEAGIYDVANISYLNDETNQFTKLIEFNRYEKTGEVV